MEITQESASKDSDGKTLERKLSKEEIISSVAQRFGVKADLEAPNSFTADIDTLVSRGTPPPPSLTTTPYIRDTICPPC
jgi:hypothetical protein